VPCILGVIESLLGTSRHSSSRLHRLPVPREFIGETFRTVFRNLLANEGLLAVALYRHSAGFSEDNAMGVPGTAAKLPYVYTAPRPDDTVNVNDHVYVLTQWELPRHHTRALGEWGSLFAQAGPVERPVAKDTTNNDTDTGMGTGPGQEQKEVGRGGEVSSGAGGGDDGTRREGADGEERALVGRHEEAASMILI
jgi:hypothetical protein